MNRYKILCLLLILFFVVPEIEGAGLKLIKTLGNDDDENYMFMRISGAVLSEKKDIYVIDRKGHFLARYDWQGKFIKKVGQRGQGPNDFNRPVDLDIFDGKLHLHDSFNARVAVVDLDLGKIDYHKLPTSAFANNNFGVIGKQRYANSCFPNDLREEYGLIKLTSLSPLSEKTFFEHTSFEVNYKSTMAGSFILYSRPVFGIDRNKKNLIVSHRYPKEPMEFYIYSYEGECLDRFSCSFDKDYSLPSFLREGESPTSYEAAIIVSIFAHKNHYIVITARYKIEKRRPIYSESSKYCFIIDSKTKLIKHRFEVAMHFKALSISEEGYVLAAQSLEEIPKLYIYKLEL